MMRKIKNNSFRMRFSVILILKKAKNEIKVVDVNEEQEETL